MKEPDKFVGIETTSRGPVAVMQSCFLGAGTTVLNLKSLKDRLRNLKAGGWAHDQTEIALSAMLRAREGEGQ